MSKDFQKIIRISNPLNEFFEVINLGFSSHSKNNLPYYKDSIVAN